MKQKVGRSVGVVSSFTQRTAAVRGVAKIHRRRHICGLCILLMKSTVGAVGKDGKILHTNDGGELWYEQRSNTERSLLGVYFVNPQAGWVVGTGGLILHTTDGGANWLVPEK